MVTYIIYYLTTYLVLSQRSNDYQRLFNRLVEMEIHWGGLTAQVRSSYFIYMLMFKEHLLIWLSEEGSSGTA